MDPEHVRRVELVARACASVELGKLSLVEAVNRLGYAIPSDHPVKKVAVEAYRTMQDLHIAIEKLIMDMKESGNG